MEKRRNCSFRSNFSSFPQYFYLLLDFHAYAGTRFSLRDKRLFERSEVEIARVNCIIIPRKCHNHEAQPSLATKRRRDEEKIITKQTPYETTDAQTRLTSACSSTQSNQNFCHSSKEAWMFGYQQSAKQ